MKYSSYLYILGFGSIILSAVNFIEGKSKSGQDGNNKQHDGNFIGHWAPTFFILGKILEDREKKTVEDIQHV